MSTGVVFHAPCHGRYELQPGLTSGGRPVYGYRPLTNARARAGSAADVIAAAAAEAAARWAAAPPAAAVARCGQVARTFIFFRTDQRAWVVATLGSESFSGDMDTHLVAKDEALEPNGVRPSSWVVQTDLTQEPQLAHVAVYCGATLDDLNIEEYERVLDDVKQAHGIQPWTRGYNVTKEDGHIAWQGGTGSGGGDEGDADARVRWPLGAAAAGVVGGSVFGCVLAWALERRSRRDRGDEGTAQEREPLEPVAPRSELVRPRSSHWKRSRRDRGDEGTAQEREPLAADEEPVAPRLEQVRPPSSPSWSAARQLQRTGSGEGSPLSPSTSPMSPTNRILEQERQAVQAGKLRSSPVPSVRSPEPPSPVMSPRTARHLRVRSQPQSQSLDF